LELASVPADEKHELLSITLLPSNLPTDLTLMLFPINDGDVDTLRPEKSIFV